MDDPHQVVSPSSLRADVEPALDSVDEQLRTEFARLDQEYECRTALNVLAGLDLCVTTRTWPRGINRLRLARATDGIRRVVDSLQALVNAIGYTPRLRQRLEFWTAALKSNLRALAKISALLARSVQATFRTPLFLDGPELSGYKHRFR